MLRMEKEKSLRRIRGFRIAEAVQKMKAARERVKTEEN